MINTCKDKYIIHIQSTGLIANHSFLLLIDYVFQSSFLPFQLLLHYFASLKIFIVLYPNLILFVFLIVYFARFLSFFPISLDLFMSLWTFFSFLSLRFFSPSRMQFVSSIPYNFFFLFPRGNIFTLRFFLTCKQLQ